MKIILQLLCLFLLNTQQVMGNNVQVSNVRLTGQDTTSNFTMVEFDISWENSWRYSNGPGNWDAVWIFVKYKIGPGPWLHAWLNNTGHQSCTATTIEYGLLTPGAAFHITTNPALGVFLYRSSAGSGTFSCQDVQLRWNYGANSVSDDAEVDVQVFAIEHVYIPEGPFKVGSGGDEGGRFYTYPDNIPYLIQDESAIQVGPTNGNLYYNPSSGASGDQLGPIPANYPKGYRAYYAMKYEITQAGYVDFLNTLSRAQQITRVRTNISSITTFNAFVMTNTNSPQNRNAISCRLKFPAPPAPLEFFCDLNANLIENEVDDGLTIACNYLQFADLAAYLDWACLRFMSEFEFEKCARGRLDPFPNEYAWGNNVIYILTSVNNEGTPSEMPADSYSNTIHSNSSGPLRIGAFARTTATRTTSGAGYYGCLDLSGNLSEKGVTIGNPQGRLYEGSHGNGLLLSNGNADVSSWPDVNTPIGVSERGGNYYNSFPYRQTSDREWAADSGNTSNYRDGGRGVRTAP